MEFMKKIRIQSDCNISISVPHCRRHHKVGKKERVSLQKNANDNTNGLSERNLAKKIITKNTVSSATQL